MNLQISNSDIRQDSDGRYSLNDLHRASGGEEGKRPGHFLRSERAVRLIEELDFNAQICALNVGRGQGQGTYAVEHLAIAYASWISVKFEILVQQAFIDRRKQEVHPVPLVNDFEAYQKLAKLIGLDHNESVIRANIAVKNRSGVNLLEDLGNPLLIAAKQEILLTPTDIAVRLNIRKSEGNKLLIKAGLQTSHRDHKDRLYYQVTEKGKEYAKILDTNRKRSNGTSVVQIKWLESVVAKLSGK